MKRRIIAAVIVFLLAIPLCLLGGANLHSLLSGGTFVWELPDIIPLLAIRQVQLLSLLLLAAVFLFILAAMVNSSTTKTENATRQIVPGLNTPMAAGHGEFGTARFATRRKTRKTWKVINLKKLMKGKKTRKPCGGVLIGYRDEKYRRAYVQTEDTHTLVIGATRCGKSRCNVLPTICIQALAGESMIVVDPKAELWGYTKDFLESRGYEVIALDFKNPQKSARYNFLQPVVDAVLLGNLPLAVQRARDVSAMLVPDNFNTQIDPIWKDGQRAALTMSILAVCIECKNPLQHNLSNARAFMTAMCAEHGPKKQLPLELYLQQLPKDSPLHMAMGIARIAPEKMRGSFYTSALTTLDLFSDPYIHSMTAVTDFDYAMTGDKKRAIFLILPDERSTYYPLATLFVYEQYQALVQAADRRGGRLPIRVNFNCDEFGNFVKIPDFDKFITVGGGRGMRFNLYVQDTSQVYERYGKNLGQTMLNNCENWIYLQSDNPDTLEELSKRLGNYTIRNPNASSSTGGNSSGGYAFTGRRLLMPEEIAQIGRPYQLASGRARCHRIMFAPDISQTPFNQLLGMGDPEHNRQLLERQLKTARELPQKISYWDLPDKYVAICQGGLK